MSPELEVAKENLWRKRAAKLVTLCWWLKPQLLQGGQGMFNILDARSHRIPRVYGPTYAAETLAAEESLDCGQFARGFIALAQGRQLQGRRAHVLMNNSAPLTAVVDAKDDNDKSSSDTPISALRR